jgi:hypothetical protein
MSRMPGRVWRRRQVVQEPGRRGRPLADKTLRSTLQKLFPKLWDHLTEEGRSHLIADWKASSEVGDELELSRTILDWHVTMAFLHEEGFRQNTGREPGPKDPVFDLDEFLTS